MPGVCHSVCSFGFRVMGWGREGMQERKMKCYMLMVLRKQLIYSDEEQWACEETVLESCFIPT